MMKKIWILFCLALLAATCALVCACTDVTGAENKHDHIYSQAVTPSGTVILPRMARGTQTIRLRSFV